MDFIIELHTNKEQQIIEELSKQEHIKQVSLLAHDGEVRF